MDAAMDTNITAPAEISLINPILYQILVEQNLQFSQRPYSMPSMPKTNPIAKIWRIHSVLEISK